MGIDVSDGSLGKAAEVDATTHDNEVPACSLCKFAQGRDVELANDVLALRVLIEPVLPILIGDGGTNFAADADGDDEDFVFLGFLGGC